MLKWTAIFLVIAVIAAIFGFTGIAEGAARYRQGHLLYFSGLVGPGAHFRRGAFQEVNTLFFEIMAGILREYRSLLYAYDSDRPYRY